MYHKQTRSAGEGLERSCRGPGREWIAAAGPVDGVELFRAWFAGTAYRKHRHDTYAVCVTDSGVQVFGYRRAVHASLPGQVTVLYPDELHDGRAGTREGFGYRIVYIEPARLGEAVRAVRGRPYPLPFLRQAVVTNPRLAHAVDDAFRAPLEPLAADGLVVELAEGLLAAERAGEGPAVSRRVDSGAVERARQLLDAERTRPVHSAELEAVSGLTRYDLARQFRIAFGTSPYRYLLMRRLDFARQRIHLDRPLVEVASDAGFADQAHFTRAFTAAYGLPPGRYRTLRRAAAAEPEPAVDTAADDRYHVKASATSETRGSWDVPEHQDALQLRTGGDRRRNSRGVAAVRQKDRRVHQPFEGERSGFPGRGR